ncbi:MAG: hypothetical protein ACPH09_05040 [Pseudomonadales bacterium]
MSFMRINFITLKEGEIEGIKKETEDWLDKNDPETTGMVYDVTAVAEDGRSCVGITLWKDKASLDASGERWDEVMEGLAHRLVGEPRREEFEIEAHNLPALD